VINKPTQTQRIHYCTLNSIILLAWLLAACQNTPTPFIPPGENTPVPGETSDFSSATLPLTESPTPTNTPIPLALTVNSESITQAEYEASLARLLMAQPDLPPEEAHTRILDEFIDQLLLSQAAVQAGFIVDRTLLEERTNALVEKIGGADALNTWLATNGYTEEFFQLELRRSIAAAWMRDQIIAGVPTTAEQVHVRQLLLFSAAEANDVFAQLQSGVTFEVMLAFYDPISLGDLGWFPRGYLKETAIEEAAFALEPGAYSPVIETGIGFHIIQLIERQADQPLSPDARLTLQEKALSSWLEQQRIVSDITVLNP
jgi:peptidyl-prolyl cis-trans isomerase C